MASCPRTEEEIEKRVAARIARQALMRGEKPPRLHIENKVSSVYLEERDDIEAYRLAYTGLSAVALPPDRSVDLIRRIAMSMT